jgi:hypothetical protein
MAKCLIPGSNRLLDAANSDVTDGQLTKFANIDIPDADTVFSRHDITMDVDTSSRGDLEASARPPKCSLQGTLAPSAQASRVLKPIGLWIPFMVLTGGSVDYLADFFTDTVQPAGIGDSAVVFLITALSFLSCAVPPTFKKEDRASIRAVNANNPLFKWKVMAPSLADLLITGIRFVAILFASPAVVSLLKNSMQLLSLSVIQHFRGKRLSCRLAACLLGTFVGQLVVSLVSVLKHEPGVEGPVAVGVALACVSGFLGALRNICEEALLQGDNLSTGALLMAESWISLFGVVITTLVWQGFQGQLVRFFHELGSICVRAEVWPILVTLMFCTYGKDFGKLFVTKYASALTAKVLCMLFPIVTWVLSLITYAATHGHFGEGVDAVASPIRLLGFSVVAGCCASFVVLQKKK